MLTKEPVKKTVTFSKLRNNHSTYSVKSWDGYFLWLNLIITMTTLMKASINIPKLNMRCNASTNVTTKGVSFLKIL